MLAAHTTRFGAPEVIELQTSNPPNPTERQMLIQVDAAAITAGDGRLRAADFPGFTALFGRLMFGFRRPRVPVQGTMFAGTVVQVGRSVRRYEVGDRVFGSVVNGAYAEQLAVSEDAIIAPTPRGLSPAEAAAVPYGADTALYFLRDLAALQPGQRVAILGAAGGVGRYAVQLAAHLGAHVTAVCHPRDSDRVTSLGAHDVAHYTDADWERRITPFDVVFDTSGHWTYRRAKPVLTSTGRFVTLYMTLGSLGWMAWTRLVGRRRALTGVAMPSQERLTTVAGWLADGTLRSTLARRLPFSDITGAHRLVDSGRTGGDIVVEMTTARASAPPSRRTA